MSKHLVIVALVLGAMSGAAIVLDQTDPGWAQDAFASARQAVAGSHDATDALSAAILENVGPENADMASIKELTPQQHLQCAERAGTDQNRPETATNEQYAALMACVEAAPDARDTAPAPTDEQVGFVPACHGLLDTTTPVEDLSDDQLQQVLACMSETFGWDE